MPRIKWSQQRVIEEIQQTYRIGQSRPLAFYAAAKRHFGSLDNALSAAGRKRLRRPNWTRSLVLEEIQTRYPKHGGSFWHDGGLDQAAYRFFGSRSKALNAAGFPTPAWPVWTSERVIAAIQTKVQQQSSLRGITQSDPKLYEAAQRHFGSWPNALQAAGVGDSTPPWTAARVLEAIQERQRLHKPLLTISKHDRPLFVAARRFLGGWRKALRAAGIEVPHHERWDPDRVLQVLRQRRDQTIALTKTQRESLYAAAVRYFGSWAAALDQVGLRPATRQRWSKERVLSATRAWYQRTGGDREQLPLALRGAMQSYWGGLGKTLQAAGIDMDTARRWSAPLVIQEIQDRYVRGHSLQRPRDVDRSLASAARFYFGGWQAALAASGLETEYRSRSFLPSSAALIGLIQTRHQQRHSMRGEDNRDLKTACQKRFGGWINTKRAAGIELFHVRWSHDKLIREIQRRYPQGPIPKGDKLRAAAVRYFGNWRNAQIAAGILQERSLSVSTPPETTT